MLCRIHENLFSKDCLSMTYVTYMKCTMRAKTNKNKNKNNKQVNVHNNNHIDK